VNKLKSNLSQYIFILIVIILIVIAIFTIYKKDENTEQNEISQEELVQETYQDIRLGIAQYDTINPLISTNKYVQEIDKIIYEPLLRLTQDYKL